MPQHSQQNMAGISSLITLFENGCPSVISVHQRNINRTTETTPPQRAEQSTMNIQNLTEQDDYQQTAFHRAAKYESLQSLLSLLDSVRDADKLCEILQLQDSEGRTALHYAVSNSPQHVMGILDSVRQCNRDKTTQFLKIASSYGQTVFHVAATKDTPNLLAYLLKASDKPDDQHKILNVQDIRGRTALHYAAMSSCHLVDAIGISVVFKITRNCNWYQFKIVEERHLFI